MTDARTPTTAFVLGGGGVLGAVEVGMLRALLERDIVPDLVLGTSVGALNGAMVASDPSLAVIGRLTDLWHAAGETGETGERYLAKAGDSVVYVVSSYLVEHMEPGAKSFVETPPPKGAPAGPAAQGMPAGGGSGQQISPEVMQQIREQLRRQGLNAH